MGERRPLPLWLSLFPWGFVWVALIYQRISTNINDIAVIWLISILIYHLAIFAWYWYINTNDISISNIKYQIWYRTLAITPPNIGSKLPRCPHGHPKMTFISHIYKSLVRESVCHKPTMNSDTHTVHRSRSYRFYLLERGSQRPRTISSNLHNGMPVSISITRKILS